MVDKDYTGVVLWTQSNTGEIVDAEWFKNGRLDVENEDNFTYSSYWRLVKATKDTEYEERILTMMLCNK